MLPVLLVHKVRKVLPVLRGFKDLLVPPEPKVLKG